MYVEEVVCKDIDVLMFLVLEEVVVDVYGVGYLKRGVIMGIGLVLCVDVKFYVGVCEYVVLYGVCCLECGVLGWNVGCVVVW